MIHYIVGKIAYVNSKFILLESNWTGYFINIVRPEQYQINKTKRIYVSEIQKIGNKNTIVRDYYGFLDLESKHLFTLLQNVPSIGPKTAMNILKNSPKLLIQLISSNNHQDLAKLPGINLALAQAICATLNKANFFVNKEKNHTNITDSQNPQANFALSDLAEALKKLGYEKDDVALAINAVAEHQPPEGKWDVSDALSYCIQIIYQKTNHPETATPKTSEEVVA